MRGLAYIPNFLTILRIAATPLLLVSLAQDRSKTTLSFLVLLALTDWLDGYLARRWNVTSAVGALLDPLADKFLLFSCYLFFVFKGHCPHWFLGFWCTCHLLQSFGFFWLSKTKGTPFVPLKLGKMNTALQLFWVGLLFLVELRFLPWGESYLFRFFETFVYLSLSAVQIRLLFLYLSRYWEELFPTSLVAKSLSKGPIPH